MEVYLQKGGNNNMNTTSVLLCNCIHELSRAEGKKIKTRLIIRRFKKEIMKMINIDNYDASFVYNFIQFINMANKLNLYSNPNGIHYNYQDPSIEDDVASCLLQVRINFGKDNILESVFRPIIDSDPKNSKISMEWIFDIKENSNNIVEENVQRYAKEAPTISRDNTDMVVETVSDICFNDTYHILRNAFILCLEGVMENMRKRYIK